MLEEKTIGKITIGTDIEQDRDFYSVPITDENIKVYGAPVSYMLPVQRTLLEQEFYHRGKNRMVQSFWYAADDEREQMHELSFAEFEEHEEYRKEFDSFVMDMAAEVLHIKDLEEAREMNLKYWVHIHQDEKMYKAKIKELETKLYQALNPNIKKAS